MHCTYCGMPKGTSRAEAMSNSEKIKLITLAIIELRLSEGIIQSVRQSVSHQKILFNNLKKFLLKAFQADLKACLGLVLPSQYCLIVVRKIETGFWVMFFMGHTYSFVVPTIQYYRTV